ncbi:MAG: hypothetical protein RhofKO_11470 [Rhodothermales bacterium]
MSYPLYTRASANERPRLALVIGSGAVNCAAALGLRRVLEREGIEVDLFVGCSGGSLYAAAWALGVPLDECERLTHTLWQRHLMTKRDPRALARAFLPKLLGFTSAFGLVDDRPLYKVLRQTFGSHRVEDTTAPLRVVATDFETGELVPLAFGAMADAIRASIAIAFVWPPWSVDGRLLSDGCLSDPIPACVAIDAGADVVIALGFEATHPRQVSSPLRFAFQVTSVYTNSLYRTALRLHQRSAALAGGVPLLPIEPVFKRRISMLSTSAIPHAIRAGARATEAMLPRIIEAWERRRQPTLSMVQQPTRTPTAANRAGA